MSTRPHVEPGFGVLDGSTWKASTSYRPPQTRTRIPCLTIVGHADVERIGERAVLTGLRVRQTVEVSRLTPQFSRGGKAQRPLADRFVSRGGVSISSGARGALVLRCEHEGVRCDGSPLSGERIVTQEQLERGVEIELQQRVSLLLHLSAGGESTQVGELLGTSVGVEQVRREVIRAAQLDVPVLVRGESGTGKEHVARALHAHSPRSRGPYVAVNMATLPESMAASELFGHARGAFTGAAQRHRGLFERAHGGTLFLDEVGETPSAVQPMLLRVLEAGLISPLGETSERTVDVRIVAATDADLDAEVATGRFRKALRHRLEAYEIRVPPLRERREDILPLFVHFLKGELHAGDIEQLAHDPMADTLPVPLTLVRALLAFPFEGNVRQLRNLARQLAVSSQGASALAAETFLERLQAGSASQPVQRASAEEEGACGAPRREPPSDEALVEALAETGWSVGRAAIRLGLPKSSVYDRMGRCASLRKAKDIPDAELRDVQERHAGDTRAMAETLQVSERALRLTLRERGLLPSTQS